MGIPSFLKRKKPVYTGETISNFFKPLPKAGSEVMLMTYNFPETAWEAESPLGKKLTEWHNNGIKIRVVGGPFVKAKEYVHGLVESGVIDVRILSKPRKEHICIATKPKQIYVERKHTDGLAKNVYYTDSPFPDVYQNCVAEFIRLWNEGVPFLTKG